MVNTNEMIEQLEMIKDRLYTRIACLSRGNSDDINLLGDIKTDADSIIDLCILLENRILEG